MSTLTSTSTLTIADAAVAVESISLTVLPVPSSGGGRGRLIHPSLGTYDYPMPPDRVVNMRGAAIIAPIWASTKTLLGAANTLFAGDVRDVIAKENWTQSLVYGGTAHIDMLLAMWMNAPDPSVATVQWYPNYVTTLGYNVALLDCKLGDESITTYVGLHNAGHERGPLVLTMRLLSLIEA